jgi:hypothetical protein
VISINLETKSNVFGPEEHPRSAMVIVLMARVSYKFLMAFSIIGILSSKIISCKKQKKIIALRIRVDFFDNGYKIRPLCTNAYTAHRIRVDILLLLQVTGIRKNHNYLNQRRS